MPAALEAKLYQEGRKKGYTGERLDRYVFGTLQKIKDLQKSKHRLPRKRKGKKTR